MDRGETPNSGPPIPASLMAAAMGDGEAKRQRRKKKPKPNHVELGVAPPQSPHAPKPLPAAPSLQTPTQFPAPGAPILEEVVAEGAMKKKLRKEHKASVPPSSQDHTFEKAEEHGKEAVLAATRMKKQHKERRSSPSQSAAVAAEAPIFQQEAEVTKKQKRPKEEGPSKPLSTAKLRKEHKAAAPPSSQDHTFEKAEEHGKEAVLVATRTKKKHKERRSSPSQSAAVAAEAPILQQEAEVTKKRKRPKEEGPSKSLSTAKFIEVPAQSPAPRTQMLEEVAAEVAMWKRKMREERKAVALALAQKPTLEEPVLATTMKKKKKKHKEHKPSPSLTAAAEAPILQQEVKMTKKMKQSKEEGPSGYSPLPLHPGQVQSQGTKAIHASKPLSAATFFEAPAQSAAPSTPMLEEVTTAVMSKRKNRKEQKVVALPLAQNNTLEEQRDNAMAVKVKGSKHMKHTLPSISTSVAAETTIWEQEAKVTKEEMQRKSPLPLHPGQSHSARSQGSKAPLEQERETDGRKGSSIEKNNGKMPLARVLSKRELIKEASKKQPVLPEGFVPFSDFVSSCNEHNPDHSAPCIAFFDQFRYDPDRGDHKPPLPRTPDRLARLLPQANGTSNASKSNNSVACRSKKKDSGSGSASGSQEKLHAKEKKNPEKKMGTMKQREPPPLLTRAEKCSDKYRRVPLDQLVPPPRSPHNLLQEKYASDPWKVIVICMLLNLTQGKQVKNIIEGFFERYPDAHSAVNADPEKMEGYLAYLGLQHIKTIRIQKFSKEYVEKEWTYITELCGVGKYAADAYAIFCAGRAREVVPKDHKLVDYWKYVCFELPMMQKSQNTHEAGVRHRELSVMC